MESVFIEFNRNADGVLKNCQKGTLILEWVLNDYVWFYKIKLQIDTDVFTPIINEIEK